MVDTEMSTYAEKFKNALLENSESELLKEAYTEWVVIGIDYMKDNCICSHYVLERIHMENKINNNLIIVGNVCIKKFFPRRVKDEVKVMRKKIKAELLNKMSELCVSGEKMKLKLRYKGVGLFNRHIFTFYRGSKKYGEAIRRILNEESDKIELLKGGRYKFSNPLKVDTSNSLHMNIRNLVVGDLIKNKDYYVEFNLSSVWNFKGFVGRSFNVYNIEEEGEDSSGSDT